MERRQFIVGASGAAAAVSTFPLTVTAKALPDRSLWATAQARYEAADKAYNAAVEREWEAEEAYHAIEPIKPAEGVILWSAGQSFTWDEAMQNAFQRKADYEAAIREARERSGFEAASKAVEYAGNVYADARDALFDCPAPDLAAAAFKASVVHESSGMGSKSLADDLARLAEVA